MLLQATPVPGQDPAAARAHQVSPKQASQLTPKAFFFHVQCLLLVFATDLHQLLENK